MLVEEVMTKDVITVGPDTSIKAAVEKMRKYDVGGLPVKKNGEIVGFVTDRDIALRGFSKSRQTRIRQIMTSEVFYCFSNQHIKAAVSTMGQLRIRRLPVLNENKQLVGILSLSDLSKNNRTWFETQSLINQLKMPA